MPSQASKGDRVASSQIRRGPQQSSEKAASAPAVKPRRRAGTPAGRPRQVRTYVHDTSVLLSDPGAFSRLEEHLVVLPLVVVTELEAKRHHPELGYFAREALRFLDDLRIEHGRLDAELPVNDVGGTVKVELNHTDTGVLPASLRLAAP